MAPIAFHQATIESDGVASSTVYRVLCWLPNEQVLLLEMLVEKGVG